MSGARRSLSLRIAKRCMVFSDSRLKVSQEPLAMVGELPLSTGQEHDGRKARLPSFRRQVQRYGEESQRERSKLLAAHGAILARQSSRSRSNQGDAADLRRLIRKAYSILRQSSLCETNTNDQRQAQSVNGCCGGGDCHDNNRGDGPHASGSERRQNNEHAA